MWKRSRTREYLIPEDPNFQQHSCGTSWSTIMILQVQLNQDISILIKCSCAEVWFSVIMTSYSVHLKRYKVLRTTAIYLLFHVIYFSLLVFCLRTHCSAWPSYINFWDTVEKQTSSYLRRCWVMKSHTSTQYDNSPPIFLALYSWGFGSFVLYRIVKLHILPAISLFNSRTVVQLSLQEVLCLYHHSLFKKIYKLNNICKSLTDRKWGFFSGYLKWKDIRQLIIHSPNVFMRGVIYLNFCSHVKDVLAKPYW